MQKFRWLDFLNVVYTDNEIFSFQEEGSSDTWNSTDESWKHSDIKGQAVCDSTYVRYLEESHFIDRKDNCSCQGLGEWEMGS